MYSLTKCKISTKVTIILILITGLSILGGCDQTKNASNNSVIEPPIEKKAIKKFSEEDLRVFKLIKKNYPEFEYSDAYVDTSELAKKMIFRKEGNLYLGCYVSYEVIYYQEGMINYFFDAGTSHRGFGSYLVIDDNTVIKTEKSAGTSAYSYEIYKTGKKLDEETNTYIK